MKHLTGLLVCFCFVGVWAVAETTILTLGPDFGADAWITSAYPYDDTPGVTASRYGVDDSKIQVGGWDDVYVGCIDLQLTDDFLPARKAILRLYCFDRLSIASEGGVPTPMHVYAITSPWEESVVGWPSKPAMEYRQKTLAPTVNNWFEIDITNIYNEAVRALHEDASKKNFGIALVPVNVGVLGQYPNFNTFYSSEYVDEQYRPQLVLDVVERSVRQMATATPRVGSSGSGTSAGAGALSFDLPFDLRLNIPPWLTVLGGPLLVIVLLSALVSRASSLLNH